MYFMEEKDKLACTFGSIKGIPLGRAEARCYRRMLLKRNTSSNFLQVA